MKLLFTYIAILALGFFPAMTTFASGISAHQKAEVEVLKFNKDGKEVLEYEPADLVEPGETVKFTIDFKNDQVVSADNAILVMPIPGEMVYLRHSHSVDQYVTKLSYDGAKTFYTEGVYPEGYKAQEMPVTHVKWEFIEPIRPYMSGSVSAFARLE